MFLTTKEIKKCVTQQFSITLMHYNLSLNSLRLKKMCDEAVNRCFFVFHSIPDWYKTQEMCDSVVFEYHFLIVYGPDKYKTQIICV